MTASQRRAGLAVTAAVTYAAGEEAGPAAREMIDAGVDVHPIGPASGRLRWVGGMRERLRPLVERADVVHVHAVWEEIQHRAASEAWRAGVPTVITPHGMLDPWSLAQGRVKKALYLSLRFRRHLKRAAAIHVTARQEYQDMKPLGLTAPAVVEPLGVDLGEFRELPAKGWLRARLPGIGGRPIVLFLSRIHPGKGVELLVPAMARAETGGAVLVLAGPEDPAYGRTIRRLVGQHGLGDRVFFTGMLHGSERVSAYVDADLFVLPSFHENFGIVVAEALAAGCPVVVTESVNAKDYVRAGKVGEVVTTEVGPLAAAIQRWMTDEPLRRDAAGRAGAFAVEHFDWSQIGRRWCGHYERIARQGGEGVAVADVAGSASPK
jgi:glycosyltransferase involved in cell wall biosynthesis